jgi:hypothetical protein
MASGKIRISTAWILPSLPLTPPEARKSPGLMSAKPKIARVQRHGRRLTVRRLDREIVTDELVDCAGDSHRAGVLR